MKRFNRYGRGIVMMAISAVALTSCIDETTPLGDTVTSEQMQASTTAAEQSFYGITAQLNANYFSSRRDYDFGYSSRMHIRDVMTQDMAVADPSGYNQYYYFGLNKYMGRDYIFSQMLTQWAYKFINTTNIVIGNVNEESATETQKGYLGAALAFRALMYLDMAREFEFLANDGTSNINADGNDVLGLTVPIVTESTTDTRNNPRAKHEEMFNFILSDLEKAERNIGYLKVADHTFPHLDVVYGLYARLYMWNEDYVNAEKYARLAINAAGTDPMTQAESTAATTGFNDITKWMLGGTFSKEALASNLQNWVAMMCPEFMGGYAGDGGCNPMLDRSMYDRLSNSDWRKLWFKAPAGHVLDGKTTYIDKSYAEDFADYTGVKFRPAGGEMSEYTTACVTSFPMMRVEEMYFIEAEAAAHQDAARGKQLLVSFMQANRDASYATSANTTDAVVEEIVFQKRIELWGEGQAFFDVKRLNISCTRGYTGTNHEAAECFNTNGRPAWMNWVIIRNEENGNAGLTGWNNPDPSDAYSPWTGN